MENKILSIYREKFIFPVDVSELQDKFDGLIVCSRLMGYEVTEGIWSHGNHIIDRFDFDIKERGFTIEFTRERNELIQVDFFYQGVDHIYGPKEIDKMINEIDFLMKHYI